jgi:hypothetical protein
MGVISLRRAKQMDGTYKRGAAIRRGAGAVSGFLPNYNFPKIRFCPKGHGLEPLL